MDFKQKQIVLLIILVILFFGVNYSFIDKILINVFENMGKKDFIVKRVIDGDTIVVGENTSVRLFGINSPEKGEIYYEEAKEFLDDLILNKTIFI